MPYFDTCTCLLCGQRKDRWECQQNPVLKATVCDDCREIHAYEAANRRRVGSPSEHIPPFSVEFEVAAPCFTLSSRLDRALLLIKYGFLRTVDPSVDSEYKSPIYQSLGPFYEPLGVMHTLRDLVTDWCGTHLHVTLHRKARLRSLQKKVFAPLLAHLVSHDSETQSFWGRTFCMYATESFDTRYASFNLLSRYDTIEYRLPRFCSAQQYLGVVRFCLQVTAYLDACLDSEVNSRDSIDPDQMAHQVLAFYQQALAHPITSIPALTKGELYV